MPSLAERLRRARFRTMRYGPGPASAWAHRHYRPQRTLYAWPRRPRNDSQLVPAGIDLTNASIMAKPPIVVGSRYWLPKPQEGETSFTQRRYYKGKGIGARWREGSDLLYQSGARIVYMDNDPRSLIAMFPQPVSTVVIDQRLRRSGFFPFSF